MSICSSNINNDKALLEKLMITKFLGMNIEDKLKSKKLLIMKFNVLLVYFILNLKSQS